MKRQDKVEILQVKKMPTSGCIKAVASIRIGSIEIRGIKIIHDNKDNEYVTMPQRGYNNKYYTVVFCHDPELLEEIERVILMAWKSPEKVQSI
ncbi:septation protein SpoVG family protein [candidate division KSB1 bacterium]|nr:septation protein SpoVG family protein [candidate division KSB1 bacterium]